MQINSYHQGSLCTIKSKKPSPNSYVVLYPDLEEVIRERIENNTYLPSLLATSDPPELLSLKQTPFIKLAKETFVLLKQTTDENGSIYFQCLYKDKSGWLINSSRNFDIIEEKKAEQERE